MGKHPAARLRVLLAAIERRTVANGCTLGEARAASQKANELRARLAQFDQQEAPAKPAQPMPKAREPTAREFWEAEISAWEQEQEEWEQRRQWEAAQMAAREHGHRVIREALQQAEAMTRAREAAEEAGRRATQVNAEEEKAAAIKASQLARFRNHAAKGWSALIAYPRDSFDTTDRILRACAFWFVFVGIVWATVLFFIPPLWKIGVAANSPLEVIIHVGWFVLIFVGCILGSEVELKAPDFTPVPAPDPLASMQEQKAFGDASFASFGEARGALGARASGVAPPPKFKD